MARARPVGPPTRHQAFIYDRGGRTQLFELKGTSEISYGRVRDDQSAASVTIPATTRDRQLANLLSVEPGRHELYIFRDGKLAWCGPASLPTSRNAFGEWTLSAKDITLYLDRTAQRAAYDNSVTRVDYVVNRLRTILTKELARKEALGYNLIDHLHFYVQDGDARTATKTARYSSTVFEHLDELAARSGIDYTVYGRELHIWDTSRPALGQVEPLTRADFLEEPTSKKYGSELATRVIATDGQGGYGIAGPESDPYYGEWEIVSQAYDQDEDAKRPTTAELIAQAKRGLNGRNPTPLNLSVPSNSGIAASSRFTPDLMVPGVYVPLRLDVGAGRTVQQMQKLQTVQVTDNAQGESVQVSLYPASSDDADVATEGSD